MIIRPCGLVVRDGRLLLMRYQYSGQQRFNLPGGNRDAGESIRECLVREFSEELGLEVTPGELLFSVETDAGNREVLHMVFQIHQAKGNPRLNPRHTQAIEVVWLRAEPLKHAPLYPALGPILGSWLRGGSGGHYPPHAVYLGRIEQAWLP